MNMTVGIALIVIVVIIGIWTFFNSRNRRWYKVERANNSIMLLYRTGIDYFRSNQQVLRFRNEQGHEVVLHWHWVLSLEEVPKGEVETVRDEIRRMQEEMKARETA